MDILKKHYKIGFIAILTALVIVSSVLYLKATNRLEMTIEKSNINVVDAISY